MCQMFTNYADFFPDLLFRNESLFLFSLVANTYSLQLTNAVIPLGAENGRGKLC